MTVGLDTSVVLRLLTGEPASKARTARARLERAVSAGETVVVTDLVLSEAYYALHGHYGFSKADARAALRALARSGVVRVSPPDASAALEPGRGAGVLDRLIHARHTAERAATWTFDRKQGALPGAVRLG